MTMNDETNYQNNPLHGVGLKNMLIELSDHYGFEILYAYLNINCFKANPSIESSVKFLKKTEWAREKVEAFYLYEFKDLPKADRDNYQLPPRDRIIPLDQVLGAPAELSLEDAEYLREERAKKSAAYDAGSGRSNDRFGGNRYSGSRGREDVQNDDEKSSPAPGSTPETGVDPWAKWR